MILISIFMKKNFKDTFFDVYLLRINKTNPFIIFPDEK